MSRSLALVLLWSASGCIVYTEDLLVEAGSGGAGGESNGGAGGTGGSGAATTLLISEIVVTPSPAEMVEVFNPGEAAVALDDVWLADFAGYHELASGSPSVASTDFTVRFTSGTMIGGGERIVLCIASASDYTTTYGAAPDYVLADLGGTHEMSTLANTNEVLVLFEWDGQSPTVRDLDILTWGDTSDAIDKSGVAGYQPDTPVADQSAASAPLGNEGLHRCDFEESSETKEGGNGVLGHDETSENMSAAFAIGTPTPKVSPPAGVCP